MLLRSESTPILVFNRRRAVAIAVTQNTAAENLLFAFAVIMSFGVAACLIG
jgi:hypothetical protein